MKEEGTPCALRFVHFPLMASCDKTIRDLVGHLSLFKLLSNVELIYLNQYFLLFFLAAFTKLITVNGQEYHLQLVDTAGQVSDPQNFLQWI